MDLVENWGFKVVASDVDDQRLIFYVRDEDGFCAITYNLQRHHCLFYMSLDFYESVFEMPDMGVDLFKEFNSRLLQLYECTFCRSPLQYTDNYKIICLECNRCFNAYFYLTMHLTIP